MREACMFTNCKQLVECELTWLISKGRVGGTLCGQHASEIWSKLSQPFKETVVINAQQ